MGNALPPISGVFLLVIDDEDEQTFPGRHSRARFRTSSRFAHGSTPPPMLTEDFDDAVTEVRTYRPTTAA
jgi:hypothetical protein